eukprot:TRINITY_DN32858_c0_g1_i1.p1 TRINITY_DN32858_c0_g1~~TRINITY_DN32858_c0_g1_i1.p1  ORF type:complete len:380 (+),score=85.60 TRINITY_DN32858_c0_g1_i1:94-1140(+)
MPQGVTRTAVLHGIRDIRIEPRPVPEPGQGEALLRVASVAICGTDHGYFNTCSVAGRKIQFPEVFKSKFGGIIGHEAAGVVEKVGPGVTAVRPGDRVCVEPGIPRLRPGDQRAAQQTYLGSLLSNYPGALTEYLTHPVEFLHVLPEHVSLDEGALVEPLAVALHGVRRAGVASGERVLVGGAGPIGLMAVLCAQARGAAEVVVTDMDLDRLAVAAKLGARAVRVPENLPGLGSDFDRVVECTGSPAGVQTALQAARRGGTVCLVGLLKSAEGVDLALILTRELVVTGIFRYADCYAEALRMISSGEVKLKPLVTHHLPLNEVAAAFDRKRVPGAVKVIVHPTPVASKL